MGSRLQQDRGVLAFQIALIGLLFSFLLAFDDHLVLGPEYALDPSDERPCVLAVTPQDFAQVAAAMRRDPGAYGAFVEQGRAMVIGQRTRVKLIRAPSLEEDPVTRGGACVLILDGPQRRRLLWTSVGSLREED